MKKSKSSSTPRAIDAASFPRVALAAMKRAQRSAERENARHGLPLIVVENGRIVGIPPRRRP